MTKNTTVCSTKLDQTRHHLSNQAMTAEDIYILGNVCFWSFLIMIAFYSHNISARVSDLGKLLLQYDQKS